MNTQETPETIPEVAVAVFANPEDAQRFAERWNPALEVIEEYHQNRTLWLVYYPTEELPFEEASR